ncbi:hypothetical protein ACKUV4_015255 [Acinetobacter baumannii]
MALSKRIDITQAQIDENKQATIASESTARVNADSALGQRIDTVQVQFLSNLATVQSEVKTVSDAQGLQQVKSIRFNQLSMDILQVFELPARCY